MLLPVKENYTKLSVENAKGRSSGLIPPNLEVYLWNAPISDEDHRWGKCSGKQRCVGVPYKFDVEKVNPFTSCQLETIELAMGQIEERTCIR